MAVSALVRTSLATVMALVVVAAPAQGDISGGTDTRPFLPTPVLEVDAMEGASSATQLSIPSGITTTEFLGNLTLDDPQGTATVLLGGTPVFTGSGQRSYRVDVPVPTGAVQGGVLPVTVQYVAADSAVECRTADAQARLSSVRVAYSGAESVPTSLASFFPRVSPQVNVTVDQDAPDDALAAALSAVGAMGHRYASPTRVTFNDRPGTAPGTRVISIKSGPNPVSATVSQSAGVPTLTLTGSGAPLSQAAAYLGATDPVRLLDSVGASGPAVSTTGSTGGLQQTLQKVAGTDQLVLSGYGSSQAYVGIDQDAFGGPIDNLKFHLPLTNTAVPSGTTAQVDVLFNNHLLWSHDLGAGNGYSLSADFTVNAHDLYRSNGLVVRLSATASQGHCLRGPLALPLEVHLATADATMTAERGPGTLAGFQRFPQVLGGALAIALRPTGADRMTNAAAAAAIVAALQQVSTGQLQVHLVTPETFVNGHDSGVLVGATPADADALKAPLRLVGYRLLGNDNIQYQATNDQPFAALEEITTTNRDVLLLGAWTPGSPSSDGILTARLARYVAAGGWARMTDDLLVDTLHQQPFAISSGAFVPSAAQLAEKGRAAYWLVLGVVALVALVGVNYLLVRRRRRVIRAIVDAQERADAAEAD